MRQWLFQNKWTVNKVLFFLLLSMVGMTRGYAYSFSAVCSTGQTLYYNITDATNHYVELTYPYTFNNPWGNYSKPEGNVIIPTTVTYNGIIYSATSIGDCAFYSCDGITSVTIGNTVTSIGDSAFRNCSNLSSVVIGNSLTSIGEYAFCDCYYLTSINVPNSVTYIGPGAFSGCFKLPSFSIPNSLTSIEGGVFSGCSGLTSINIPNSVTTIGGFAFDGCMGLTSIFIGNSVTSIGDHAFNSCSYRLEQIVVDPGNIVFDSRNNCNAIIKTGNNELVLGCKNTVIPNTVTSIGYQAFYNCSMTSIDIPNSIISIESDAFNNCTSLTSIEIPNSVISIGASAFCWDNKLNSLLIPSSVVSIGSGAFYYCSGLNSMIILSETPIVIDGFVFQGVPKTIPVHVPCGSIEAYQSAQSWSDFSNYYEINCPYSIAASINPAEAGTVTGAGDYEEGQNCTLTATANEGYTFVNWTENGEVVSTEAEYTFTVTGERTLVANFIPPYFTIESLSNNNTIKLNIPSGITSAQLTSVLYSTDGTNWTTLTVNSTNQSISVTLGVGEKVYFKGLGVQYGLSGSNSTISSTGNIKVYGNIMSLLYGDDFVSQTEFPAGSANTFCGLFRNNTHMISAENLILPSTSLAHSCYNSMFQGCTSLTSAPTLPATTLAYGCYQNMFGNCSSLSTPPELPATTLTAWCYSYMFSGCSSLMTAPEIFANTMDINSCYCMFQGCSSLLTPPELPATSLAQSCYYQMFQGCTSLTSAPTLPATTLAYGCYQCMFSNCSSLSTPPELPATTLTSYCYSKMFSGCSTLMTAPELPAVTLNYGSYQEMFKDCPLINEITCMATDISASNCTTDWLSGVASAGTFHKNPEMLDWPLNSPSGIPEGWMVMGNRYEIDATANPIEGGTITGAGMYDEGSLVTLTAIPAEGYTFVNWTENGEEVSSNATYSFAVTSDRTLVANFSTNSCYWNPVTGMSGSMTILGILKIDGVEPYADYLEIGAFCGEECRGSALPQFISGYCIYALNVVGNTDGDPITFRLYDHHLGQELDLYCTNELTFENGMFYGSEAFYEFNFVSQVLITAIADPDEGGTVSGAGTYNRFSTCTLTATAAAGYTFINWTLENEVVSADAQYTFEVSEAGDYVAHFSLNSYEITATASPVEGGTVSGGGVYNHFSTCTLTALSATGYTFVNWTLDGVEVSTDASYTFEVSGTGEYVAHFSLNSYEIVAMAVPTFGGTVTGAGTYNHFQTCTLTAIANESFQFIGWLMDGESVSNETTYTFEVNGPVTFTALFEMVQSVELSQGWTWWGTSVEQSGIDGLGLLENSLNPNGRVIKTSDKFVQYNAIVGWTGDLVNLINEEGYRIQTLAACTTTITGVAANPEDHPITIQHNWTWIGYPVLHQQTVGEALSGFEPLENDIIKSQGSSARYVPSVGWIPADFTLNPGESYMYYSKASDDKTLVYANGRSMVETKDDDRHWRNDIHAYADNLCLLAVVEIDGEEQRSEEIELGAFVNGECRGSARLMYVEYFDRYYAMMNVMGEEDDEVEFALIDRRRDMTSVDSPTRLTFVIDAIVGEFNDPFVVSFGGLTSTEEHAMRLVLYPNPVVRNEEFRLIIPDDETVVEWTIVNAQGAVVRQEKGAVSRQIAEGLPVSGVYVVRVMCKSGNVYRSRLVVK